MNIEIKSLLKYNHLIKYVDDDRCFGDGIFVYLHEGLICPEMGCGMIVEDNLKEIIRLLKTVVKEEQ
jgi:hypothetical protein